MFFEPKFWQKGHPVTINRGATVEGTGYGRELVEGLLSTRGSEAGTVKAVRFSDALPADLTVASGEETYAVTVTEEEVILHGATERARIYAAVTLKEMCDKNELFVGRWEDTPDCPFRGYRGYLPGRKSFRLFYDTVDLLAYYKYNYLFLEVGGAMEYRRHPEINEVWKEFTAETHKYSGRTKEIQNGRKWRKNSIHTDNGEGDVLTQDEVRHLVAYARSRGLTVCPEVPTLSHSDYLCMAHPEIRERAEDDDYPDTYCPNHPDTYPLVFDVLEEILEVFRPPMVHIGHDEFYTMALCPRCRTTKPHDLFVKDVKTIHDWLQERGVRTAMWSDKMIPAVSPTGRTFGGAGNAALYWPDDPYYVPETYYCQYLLPRDILMCHWLYQDGLHTDFIHHVHGYEMVLGNLSAPCVESWRDRRRFGMKGGYCSNWGSYHPEYVQRNNLYYQMIFGAFALWSDRYDTDRRPEIMERSFREAFDLHFGSPEENPLIFVTHTTDRSHGYHTFVDGLFIEDKVYRLGRYKATYTDGAEAFFEVKYGTNISNQAIPCSWDNGGEFDPDMNLYASPLGEVCYSALPSVREGKTVYTTAYPNPYPEKELKSFEYLSESEAKVEVFGIKYGEKEFLR